MPQLFKRRSTSLLRLGLASLVLFALAAFGIGEWIYSSQYYTLQSIRLEQPVPFSHRHHAGELGIDCRYCHQTVEKSSFAGIPSPATCMHCHTQMWPGAKMLEPIREAYEGKIKIAWNRVHNLPDYVYFDHSIHVKKGIGCASCHGRIDQMPLTEKAGTLQMLWCLDCHRHPARHVRPLDEITNMEWKPPTESLAYRKKLASQYRIQSKTDCYTCHR